MYLFFIDKIQPIQLIGSYNCMNIDDPSLDNIPVINFLGTCVKLVIILNLFKK